VSTLSVVPLEYPTHNPPCCAQAWCQQCTRTAKRTGRLATASSACQNRTGHRNCKARREGPSGPVLGSARLGKKPLRRWARQVRIENTAKGRGGRRARGKDGSAPEGRGVRARCVRRRAAHREWQCSVRRRAGRWNGNEAAWTGPWRARDGSCQGARGCLRAPTTAKRPLERVTAWSCVAVRLILGLCRTASSDGVWRGGAPRWPRRPRAPAGANRAG
jgi:hypothetical protein